MHFTKNLLVTFLSILKTLLFFKLVAFFISTEVLAEYFKIKVVATIFFYFTSLRFSEILYIYRGKENFSFKELNKLQYTFTFFGVVIAPLISLLSYYFFKQAFPFIVAYFILVSIEIIESYVSLLRLFNKFFNMGIIRIILFVQPCMFYFLFKTEYFKFTEASHILLFEGGIIFFLLIIYLLSRITLMKTVIPMFKLLKNKISIIKNSWLTSVSKISYDSLPNYLLSLYASDYIYVLYNIARKIYGILIVGQWSVIQVFNTKSIELKDKFNLYIRNYYKVILTINILVFIGTIFLGEFFVGLLTQEEYGNFTTISYLLTMIGTSFLLFSLYPFRQWYLLSGNISYNNNAILLSIICSLLISLSCIQYGGAYIVSALQPFGQLLPIIITYLLLPKKIKKDLLNSFRGKNG